MRNIFIRFKNTFVKPEFVKFLLVGFANTAFSGAVYLLLNIILPYKIAYSMAYISGLVFSYILNAKWVFQEKLNKKSFFAFPLAYVPQYVIGLLCLHVLVERFAVSEQLAFLFVVVLSIPITFLMSRYIIKSSA